jgi:enamine deaminase RidA (YjgF/YER057c/UK114 family)
MAMGIDKEVIGWEEAEPLGLGPGAWPKAARVGNIVFMQGQTGFDMQGNLVSPYDAGAQARQACENIRTLIERLGGTMQDILKITVYVTDRAYRAQVYPEIVTAFSGRCPCSTGLVVSGLARPDLVVEIDAYAVIAGRA